MQFFAAWAMMGALAATPATVLRHNFLSDRAAARFLDQATWGPSAASITELEHVGVLNWLDEQLVLNDSDIPDQPLLNSAGKANNDVRPVQAAFFRNAVAGRDQLRQRVAFALSQMWVVSAVSGVPNAYAYPPYWRIFRDGAFGNYRDLIRAVSLSPAMGRYLNMANNNKGNPARNTSANENYARELMQLFTLGLTQLKADGTPVLDSNGHPMPTFDQMVVTETARALTGWTYPVALGVTPRTNNPPYYLGPMIAVEAQHDTGAKSIVGNTRLPAGQTAAQDLDGVIDALMNQPTMAPFVCRQLIEHLVTSNPSPAYLARVSQVFLDNGQGVQGDLGAVVRAILTDTEAREGDAPAPPDRPKFGHLREPILFVTNLLRGLDATLTDASTVYALSASLGEDLFRAPSVFSYFSPNYHVAPGLAAPEFQIYSTQTAISRAGIVNAAIYGTLDRATTVDLTPFIDRAGDANELLDYIGRVFLHGSVPAGVRQAAMGAAAAAATPKAKAQAALYIVLTSGEYQVAQ